MAEQHEWSEKRDGAGHVIPGWWVTDSGYTIAQCRLPAYRFAIIRPEGGEPFAYTGNRDEIERLIQRDRGAD